MIPRGRDDGDSGRGLAMVAARSHFSDMRGGYERSLDMQIDEVRTGTFCSSTAMRETGDPRDELRAAPDERLVPLALDGSRDAWGILIERHDRRVLVMLLARGSPIDRARDMTQETWARLIEHQRAGRLERLDLPGLAMRQATFLWCDETRRTSKTSPIDPTEEMAFLADPSPSVEHRLVTRSQLEKASAALDRCPPNARRVFELVYDNPETPQAVTARRVGMSVERLRHVICEVRAKLRAALDEEKVSFAFSRTQTREVSDD